MLYNIYIYIYMLIKGRVMLLLSLRQLYEVGGAYARTSVACPSPEM